MSTRIDAGGVSAGWGDDYDAGFEPASDAVSLPEQEPEPELEQASPVDTTDVPQEDEGGASSSTDSFGLPENATARECLAERDEADHVASSRREAVVEPGQGVLSALNSAGVADEDLPAAYGSLVSSGQLRAADFRGNIPVVQPGRRFEVDGAEFNDDNAALGKRLIQGENRSRIAAQVAAIQSLTRPTESERQADPNYRLVADSQARQAAYRPPVAVPAPPSPGFIERAAETVSDIWHSTKATVVEPGALSRSYGEVVTSWAAFKDEVRRDNDAIAVADKGGAMTAAVAFTQAPRELGFKLVDAGLALGENALSVADSARAGTLVKDAVDTFGPVSQRIAEAVRKSDTYRLSVSVKDAKFMVGTDRIGVQYKTRADLDEVTRLTYRWGADNAKVETVLEKNTKAIPVARGSVMGVPMKAELVPGLRQNVSGSRAVTPSLNLDIGLQSDWAKELKLKVSFEVRQSGS